MTRKHFINLELDLKISNDNRAQAIHLIRALELEMNPFFSSKGDTEIRGHVVNERVGVTLAILNAIEQCVDGYDIRIDDNYRTVKKAK